MFEFNTIPFLKEHNGYACTGTLLTGRKRFSACWVHKKALCTVLDNTPEQCDRSLWDEVSLFIVKKYKRQTDCG